MKVPVGCDHAGFALKQYLRHHDGFEGIEWVDFGTDNESSVDYPDYLHPVAMSIQNGEYEIAVIICGSGQGAAMVVNKYPAVRAAVCWNSEQAVLSRMHNNANIISLPGRFIEFEEAYKAVKLFFTTPFEGGRHVKRVRKIPPSKKCS